MIKGRILRQMLENVNLERVWYKTFLITGQSQ